MNSVYSYNSFVNYGDYYHEFDAIADSTFNRFCRYFEHVQQSMDILVWRITQDREGLAAKGDNLCHMIARRIVMYDGDSLQMDYVKKLAYFIRVYVCNLHKFGASALLNEKNNHNLTFIDVIKQKNLEIAGLFLNIVKNENNSHRCHSHIMGSVIQTYNISKREMLIEKLIGEQWPQKTVPLVPSFVHPQADQRKPFLQKRKQMEKEPNKVKNSHVQTKRVRIEIDLVKDAEDVEIRHKGEKELPETSSISPWQREHQFASLSYAPSDAQIPRDEIEKNKTYSILGEKDFREESDKPEEDQDSLIPYSDDSLDGVVTVPERQLASEVAAHAVPQASQDIDDIYVDLQIDYYLSQRKKEDDLDLYVEQQINQYLPRTETSNSKDFNFNDFNS